MRAKKKIYKKNIRVTKSFKEALIKYADGREVGDTVTKIILWYNIDFKLQPYNEALLTSIKYSSVQQEPLEVNGDKGEMITIKLDWSDYEVFQSHCTLLGIETSEGVRRVIRQVIDRHQSV